MNLVKWRLVLLLLAMAVLAGLAALAPASANAAGAPALIRAAHFSPDTPGVDVYLTSFAGGKTTLWVPDAQYGGVSNYERVPAGLYVVSMRPHGAAMSTKPVISWNLSVRAGQAYTTAAVGANKALRSIVLHDNLALPPRGDGRVRLVQAASRAPRAEVVAVDGPTVASAAPFATTTGYTTVPAGTWSLTARSASSAAVRTSARVSVASGSVTSVLLLGSPDGGITLRTVLDAAGAGVVPAGAVPAGGGGTATVFTDSGSDGVTGTSLPLLVLGGAVAAGGTLTLARRRRTA